METTTEKIIQKQKMLCESIEQIEVDGESYTGLPTQNHAALFPPQEPA